MSIQLNAEQTRVVELFQHSRLLVLTGGPGVGKTVVTEFLNIPGEKTLRLTPTGCSANRIKVATGADAFVFDHLSFNQELLNEYRGANVILDEASMVSMEKLLLVMNFLTPKRLCIIGDPQQLPCISGTPILRTLQLMPGIPRVHLTQNHRQLDAASDLVRAISAVGNGRVPSMTQDGTLKIMIVDTDERVLRHTAQAFLADPEGSQMLAFTNVAVTYLNQNTRDTPIHRVVCTRNLYDGIELLVANGVMGVEQDGVITYANGFVDENGKSKYEPGNCLTVHKSQGSEYAETGIIALTWWRDPPIELMYTALSRFKRKVVIVGTRKMVISAFAQPFAQRVVDRVLACGME